MQTTLTTPNKKADKYGKIQPPEVHDDEALDDDEDFYQTAEEFYEGLRESIREVKEAIAGRIQLKSIEELIAELRNEDWSVVKIWKRF